MILTDQIHRQIVGAIRREPKKALILPSFCYWRGRDQPVVYIEDLPETLSHVLYRELVGPLAYNQSLVLKPGVPKRNVNPLLFEVVERRRRGSVCPNGHPYKGNEMPENLAKWRCRICFEAWREKHRTGGLSVSDINREKDTCPNNHPYSGENLRITASGRRRCRQCHREKMAAYRAAQKRKETTDELPRQDRVPSG